MKISEAVSRKHALEKEVRELSMFLNVATNHIYLFDGVLCYIHEIHPSTNSVELLTIATTYKKFSNGSECRFVDIVEFEENAVVTEDKLD